MGGDSGEGTIAMLRVCVYFITVLLLYSFISPTPEGGGLINCSNMIKSYK